MDRVQIYNDKRREGLQARWVIWAIATKRDLSQPFGGCGSNAEYIEWITTQLRDWKKAQGMAPRTPMTLETQKRFTEFLKQEFLIAAEGVLRG